MKAGKKPPACTGNKIHTDDKKPDFHTQSIQENFKKMLKTGKHSE